MLSIQVNKNKKMQKH